MRRLIAVPVLGIVAMLCSCQSDRPTASDRSDLGEETPINENALSVPWEAEIRTQCNSATEEDCPGAFGFTVHSNGEFRIGPGPQGQFVEGRIRASELESLREKVRPLLRSEHRTAHSLIDNGARVCLESTEGTMTRTIRVARSKDGRSGASAHGHGLGCLDDETRHVNPGNPGASDSESLLQELSALLKQHHPAEFPSPCTNANWALRQLEESLRNCRKNEDCAYIDPNYTPIGPAPSSRLLADDCSYGKPLIAANAFEVLALQRTLLLEKGTVQIACETEFPRLGCDGEVLFDARRGPALCIAGKCQAGALQ